MDESFLADNVPNEALILASLSYAFKFACVRSLTMFPLQGLDPRTTVTACEINAGFPLGFFLTFSPIHVTVCGKY